MHRIPARSLFLRIILSFLCVLLLTSGGTADQALRGYDKENGYLYVVLGAVPPDS